MFKIVRRRRKETKREGEYLDNGTQPLLTWPVWERCLRKPDKLALSGDTTYSSNPSKSWIIAGVATGRG